MSDETSKASGARTPGTGSTGTADTATTSSGANGSAAGAGAAELQDEIERRYHELEERYDEMRGVLEHYNESAQTFIREHPAACIAGAVGLGYLVGRLASRRWLK